VLVASILQLFQEVLSLGDARIEPQSPLQLCLRFFVAFDIDEARPDRTHYRSEWSATGNQVIPEKATLCSASVTWRYARSWPRTSRLPL